jgi:hypothetical protein
MKTEKNKTYVRDEVALASKVPDFHQLKKLVVTVANEPGTSWSDTTKGFQFSGEEMHSFVDFWK